MHCFLSRYMFNGVGDLHINDKQLEKFGSVRFNTSRPRGHDMRNVVDFNQTVESEDDAPQLKITSIKIHRVQRDQIYNKPNSFFGVN